MKLISIISLLLSVLNYAQKNSFDFHSPENKKKFADFLFCQGDYLRAVEEYESIRKSTESDTINFKIMFCYSELGLYAKAKQNLVLSSDLPLSSDFHRLFFKTRFQEKPSAFYSLFEMGAYPFITQDDSSSNYFNKLTSLSYLYAGLGGRTKDEILEPFDAEDKSIITSFYNWKADPPYKNETIAGMLSAIIPGSGKMYVGEWGDGITAFLVTGLLAFLAYDNFRADHITRAWIFTGLGAFFYAGSIYGSVASAQIFNARINFEFENGLNLFLEQNNYFMLEYDFCN